MPITCFPNQGSEDVCLCVVFCRFCCSEVCLRDLCDAMKGQLNVLRLPGSCWWWPTMTASPPRRTQRWWRSPSSSRLSFQSSLGRSTGTARHTRLPHSQWGNCGFPRMSTCSLIYWWGDKQENISFVGQKCINYQVRIQNHQIPSICSSEVSANKQEPTCSHLVGVMLTDLEGFFFFHRKKIEPQMRSLVCYLPHKVVL